MNCNCNTNNTNTLPKTTTSGSMEDFIKAKQQYEDQVDYQFIQRIIQELTQSCALPIPIPASAIPPLILQAAQYFWQNDDQSVEERWLILPNSEFNKCGPNLTVKLPSQIVSVFGLYKTTNNFNYGTLGDFSLERMLINNSVLSSGVGGTLTDVYGGSVNYRITDVVASLYEVETYKSVFDVPVTYNYNEFSNELIVLGALGNSDLILNVYCRLRLQDLYKNYYFFRYCVALGLRSMATIMGTFEFKLPGGVQINYSNFNDRGNEEIQRIEEWIAKNHACDYFFNTNTI